MRVEGAITLGGAFPLSSEKLSPAGSRSPPPSARAPVFLSRSLLLGVRPPRALHKRHYTKLRVPVSAPAVVLSWAGAWACAVALGRCASACVRVIPLITSGNGEYLPR